MKLTIKKYTKKVSAQQRKKSAQTTATISLVLALILMCGLKLWFTLFIMLAFSLILTLLSGKANYCTHFCPMGFMMDNCGSKNYEDKKGFKYNKLLRILLQLLFWGSIVLTVVTKETPHDLWSGMLVIMLTIGFSSIIMQELWGKRYFCIHFCPYRLPLFQGIIKVHRFIKKRVKK